MDVDAARIVQALTRIEDRLQSIDRRLGVLEAAAELSAVSDRQHAEALERILTLIAAEPASGENDLCETLRQLVAVTQANGELLGRIALAIHRLPAEIADHVARETAV